MPSKDVTKLKKRYQEITDLLESGYRKPSAMGRFKLNKLDIQNLRRELKEIKAKLDNESGTNELGRALPGEIGEPGTTMPPADEKASSRPKKDKTPEDKPKLVKRKGPSYSDDMTQDDYGLMEKVRIRDKAKEENIGEAAAEANLKKGGTVRKAKPSKYGMKHGGFTKRGGMYKKGMS